MLESLSVGQADLSELSFSRHMYIHVNIGNENSIALVDTSTSGLAFVSKSLCDRLKLPQEPLQSAISLMGFEGKKGSSITKKASFPLSIGNHSEILSAYVTDPCKYDLILGLLWLEKHAPYIDWKENTITFGEFCLEKLCCHFETTVPYFNSLNQSPRL